MKWNFAGFFNNKQVDKSEKRDKIIKKDKENEASDK